MQPRFWFPAILLLISISAMGQRGAIRGRVIDAKTLQPLPFANVYFNYTSVGTSTDGNGEFTLTMQPGTHELVVSFVGYKSYQSKVKITDNITSQLTTIKLSATILAEVQVKSTRDKRWAQQLEKFKRLFFGNSANTNLCTILNTWALDFAEDNEGVFTAGAYAPLYIENLGLGYKIFYQLNRFSVGPTQFTISGTVRFQEMHSTDSLVTQLWTKNRDAAYRGSNRHLFKSIINNNIEEEGFAIYEDISRSSDITRSSTFLSNINKNIKEFSLDGKISLDSADHEYKIKLPSRLEVHYLNKKARASIYRMVPHPISWIEVKQAAPVINSLGVVVNPASIVVLGALSDSRIADILPYDYNPVLQERIIPEGKKVFSASASLAEKPYLHTDKSYYFPNETIWLKAYMNYQAPAMKDSLSRVLYVELVNASRQVVTTRIFSIQNGMASASLTLPKFIPKGDYQLRAFTRWMHNYDPSFTFIKPIKILDDLESVHSTGDIPKLAFSPELKLQSNKEVYSTREEIKVTLELKNFYDFQEATNLSISVTDINQVVPPLNESTILSDFGIEEENLPDTLHPNKDYSIQTGIDFRGQFLTKKKKRVQGRLTLVQEETSDIFVTTTDKDGAFHLRGLLIYDSIPLSIQATTVKRKRPGEIKLDSMDFSPAFIQTAPLQLPVQKSDNTLRAHLYDEEQLPARLLEEVTIEATKAEEILTSARTPHFADFQISGDWLLESNSNDVLQSLRTKVTGMRVSIFMENGVPRKYLSFGVSSFGSATSNEPLLLIDGLAISSDGDMTVAERLSAMNPYEIERIDVIKSGAAAAYGARGGNGVIAIYTRRTPPALKPVAYDKSKLQPLRVAGFSSFRKFIPADYSEVNDPSKKDYRSVIHWNPTVVLDGKKPTTIRFFAADLPTTYRIVVEGVAALGKPVRNEKIITVVKNP